MTIADIIDTIVWGPIVLGLGAIWLATVVLGGRAGWRMFLYMWRSL